MTARLALAAGFAAGVAATVAGIAWAIFSDLRDADHAYDDWLEQLTTNPPRLTLVSTRDHIRQMGTLCDEAGL